MNTLEYNTSREKMSMKEYGRSVHRAIQHLLSIEDDQLRQQKTEALVKLLAILVPQPKNQEDNTNMYWDHVIIMSDFKLKVNSPFPYPTPDEVFSKPELIAYPSRKMKFKHFGRNFEKMMDFAINEKDDIKKNALIQILAYYMKLAYKNWHEENVHDDFIKDELYNLSNRQLLYSHDLYVKLIDNNKQPNIKNNLAYRKLKKSYTVQKRPKRR